MSCKTKKSKNQTEFALEILKLLAEKPRKRDELADLMSIFLENHNQPSNDIPQKITRTIAKLRECGIKIKSAPHHPYELQESSFPVILSIEQRQALKLAADFLAEMGFSAQAGQITRIVDLKQADQIPYLKTDFNPPVDYSENAVSAIARQLQERFEQKRRYTIRYCNPHGEERMWDVDRSELRLHNGTLYLFALLPDWRSQKFQDFPNVDQNVPFRVDRIINVGAASNTHWLSCDFPALDICYRMSGPLRNYKPRRKNEFVIVRDKSAKYVDIQTTEDCLFWFKQRILQYGANVQILKPTWLAEDVRKEHENASKKYCL